MPSHWTYDSVQPAAELAQGDIIEPTPEFQSALREFHGGFIDPKYVAFMVLTQSCDLVRRPRNRGHPVNLCVVREMSSIARTLMGLFCGSEIDGVFVKECRNEGRMFLNRVINQNEQAVGLFYLHPDADAGVTRPCVAMLRIAFALHSRHHETIKNSRCGRLKPEFQAKLGWLVGNLSSRIATADWSEPKERKREEQSIVDAVLDSLVTVTWASFDAVNRAKRAGFAADGKSPDEIGTSLDSLEPRPLDEQVRDELKRIIAQEDLGIDPDAQIRLLKRLPNDASMAELFRRMRKL